MSATVVVLAILFVIILSIVLFLLWKNGIIFKGTYPGSGSPGPGESPNSPSPGFNQIGFTGSDASNTFLDSLFDMINA